MIRFVSRFVGVLLLAGAFVALLYDGTKSIAANQVALTSLRQMWDNVHPGSIDLLRSTAERRFGEATWQFVSQTVLDRPACLILGILGAVLILLGRKKKKLIGYARD